MITKSFGASIPITNSPLRPSMKLKKVKKPKQASSKPAPASPAAVTTCDAKRTPKLQKAKPYLPRKPKPSPMPTYPDSIQNHVLDIVRYQSRKLRWAIHEVTCKKPSPDPHEARIIMEFVERVVGLFLEHHIYDPHAILIAFGSKSLKGLKHPNYASLSWHIPDLDDRINSISAATPMTEENLRAYLKALGKLFNEHNAERYKNKPRLSFPDWHPDE